MAKILTDKGMLDVKKRVWLRHYVYRKELFKAFLHGGLVIEALADHEKRTLDLNRRYATWNDRPVTGYEE